MSSRPNLLQTALLYETGAAPDLGATLAAFLTEETAQFNRAYHVLDMNGASHFRCMGPDELTVFVERVNGPAHRDAFAPALGATFNQLFTPDAAMIIDRHGGHVLINAHHGSATAAPQFMGSGVGGAPETQSLGGYLDRIGVVGRLAALLTERSDPLLGHWTHTDVLAHPKNALEEMRTVGPTYLQVHPLPFRGANTRPEEGVAGFVTHGAAYFIGGEVRMRATTIPWTSVYDHVLQFIRAGVAQNGVRPVADGALFGDAAAGFIYRVHHNGAPVRNAGAVTRCYDLEPLYNAAAGFRAPGFAG